ncbi:efflux RND transporter periplasmic adaptor subunit [Methylotenera sp.]|uniref:efflux RND transporter periplasmic adaptor subunit n=1 Tax=Methylotenera sp. TaxID=2051956 RepID=UPI002488FD4C|nr:efflux RND transporter periplasmic adaptor subunit [Methylotenera sp.]MDI1297893.1 efflux RND transporter periplasmic adaptor subunit [Methylotenera sp.]
MNTQKQKFRKISLIIIGLLLVTGLVYYKVIHKDNTTDKVSAVSSSAGNSPKASLTVTTVKPQQTTLNRLLSANGNIAAWQESSVSSEVNGLLLSEVLVNLGDHVKRGQVLAKFAASTIDADLAQMQANVAEANATLLEAESNANRARSIQDSGVLSKQQIEQYFTAEASAKARLSASQATMHVQNIKLKQTTVIAPDDGLISLAPATVGTVYTPGQELFRLIRKARIEWRADLTSADISQIKTGMKVQITLPDSSITQGSVRSASPVVDTKTRNAVVFVDIPAGSAKTGMFARGNFILGETQSLTLPNDAIVMRDGFAYVMQVEGNQIKQTKVQLGQRTGDRVELLNFDAPEADIVESGGAFLADGDSVKVVQKAVQKAAE